MHCGLAAARQEPVDKNFCRVWIGSAFDQAHRPAAGGQLQSFLPVDVVELIHRQSLVFCLRRLTAAYAKWKFSLRQPVGNLAAVSSQGRLHVAVQPFDKLRPQLGMIVHELKTAAETRAQRILGNVFALPFGRDQIPIGFKFLWAHQIHVVIKSRRRWIGDVNKNMALLRVGVAMPSFVPFTLVEDFRQDQRGLDRIERFALVKDFVIGIRPAAEKIGDYPAGAHFTDNPCSQAVARAVDTDQLNFGKLFAERIEQRLGAVAADVEVKLALLLCASERFLPRRLPGGLCVSRNGRFYKKAETKK